MKTVIRPLVPRMEYGLRFLLKRIPYSLLLLMAFLGPGNNVLGQSPGVACYNTINISINSGTPTRLHLSALTPQADLTHLQFSIDDREKLVFTCADVGNQVIVMLTDTLIDEQCMVIINVEDKAPLHLECRDTAITRLGNLDSFFPYVINTCKSFSDLQLIDITDGPIFPFTGHPDTAEYYGRTWKVLDFNGELDSCTSRIYRIKEKIPPVIVAVADTMVILDENKKFTLDTNVLISSLTDNSGCISSLVMTGSGIGTTTDSGLLFFNNGIFKTFTCADTGSYKVEIIATDCDHNTDTVYSQLTVKDTGNCVMTPFTSIAGRIRVHGDIGLPGATVQIEGSDYIGQSDREGRFTLNSFLLNSPSKVTISRDDSWSKGLSVMDLKMIQDHILNLRSLNSWQKAAADFDDSGTITSLDLVEIRRLILGYVDSYENRMTPWIFSNYELSEDFSHRYEKLIDQGSTVYLQLFAAKKGDVNGDIDVHASARSNIPLNYTKERLNSETEKYVIHLTDLAPYQAYQFSLSVVDGNIIDVIHRDHQYIQVEGNRLSCLYYRGVKKVHFDQNLEIIVRSRNDQSNVRLNSSVTPSVYKSEGERYPIALNRINEDFGEFDVSIYPNPVENGIQTLNYFGKKDKEADVRITIYNSMGQEVFFKRFEHQFLHEIFPILLPELTDKGCYYVVTQLNDAVLTKQIIKI